MFDLYRLPSDFPNMDQAQSLRNPYKRVKELESGLAADVTSQRFIPYVQLHEFEGLLFSDVQVIDQILRVHSVSQLTKLEKVRVQFQTPEEIDDGEATAPSKRLKSLYPGYAKVSFGVRIAQRIGLDTIRRECPHFNEWVSKLEALASQA